MSLSGSPRVARGVYGSMKMALPRFMAFLVCAASASACGDGSGTDASVDAACGARSRTVTTDPGLHVDVGTPITWATNPPSSGTHYPIWATWGVHDAVVPRGYYVHNEEHGGVVIAYRCIAPDCTPIREQLRAFVNSLPDEPRCVGSGVRRRIVLTEDPLIDDPIAAASWGAVYTANCFDDVSLRAFVTDHTGHAPEDECAQGGY